MPPFFLEYTKDLCIIILNRKAYKQHASIGRKKGRSKIACHLNHAFISSPFSTEGNYTLFPSKWNYREEMNRLCENL
jgi:hypothetical protein